MNKVNYIAILSLCALFFLACEEEFIPPNIETEPQYVVEGYVEAGEGANPTYVLISRTVPFFGEIDVNAYADLFVSDASVTVSDGDANVVLQKICLSDLPDGEIKEQVEFQLGIDSDSIEVDFCLYADLFDQLAREVGRSYDLTITLPDATLTATTTIPESVALDSFEFREIPGTPIDSLANLFCRIVDPPGPTYYRYFTEDDFGNLNTAFNSVTDDVFFDDQEFEFPITQADNTNVEDFDFETYGFFNVGDTVTIKWCTIDQQHFDFWNTYEYSLNSQGSPFTAYTRISDNIEGGFGIWGGYSVNIYELVVEK